MELVLEDTQGLPEDCLLSVKVGNTKRQAPASKLGQPFRFSTSLADPSPVKVELFVPAAPAQAVTVDPTAERFQVSFGSMQVTFSQKASEELERPPVNIKGAAEAKGLPAEKLQVATKAADYLEEHDLVKTFQDILQGLLTARPEDPFAYVEERFARQRKLADAKKGKTRSRTGPMSDGGSSRRTSQGGKSKVEMVLNMVQRTRENLPMVFPLLPTDLRASLESSEFIENCKAEFMALDSKGAGRLGSEDLVPLLVSITSAKVGTINAAQCQRFLTCFDANDDGAIDIEEFVALVQFAWIGFYLDSEEGKQTIEFARLEEESFNDFMKMIEEDVERLWSIIPFLPEWLSAYITSDEFMKRCSDNFTCLDKDNSGNLEPAELYPVIESMCQAHPLTITVEKCSRFTLLFDTRGNGVITREEFLEFAQFLMVMNFLASSDEGQEVQQRAELASESQRTRDLLDTLEGQPTALLGVLRKLPSAVVKLVDSAALQASCDEAFGKADPGTGVAPVQSLFGVLEELLKNNAFFVTIERCSEYAEAFGKSGVSKAEYHELARYAIVMAYLEHCQEHQDMLTAEVLLGEGRIQQLLAGLKESLAQISEIAPFLPDDLVDYIQSDSFTVKCMEEFDSLDQDCSGSLEPAELFPVILNLAETHHYALTQDHCRRFVDIFDVAQNGVITRTEYLNFARFMLIMGFLQTEDGQLVKEEAEYVQAQTSVEELLEALEKDRAAVHKVIPLLPRDVYQELTSDDFVLSCEKRFMELDQNRTGVLEPELLFDVIGELSSAVPGAVTFDQCNRFTAIFDVHGDGVLRRDEFLDLTRFLCVMSYLHSEEGQAACKDAFTILEDSKRVDELLETMQSDRSQIHKILPYLPDQLRSDLLAPSFTVECSHTFKELDKDGSGTLDPMELYPMVLGLAGVHELSLDIEQCQRFMAIFDDEKTGVISKDEYVNFARFLIIMSFLRSQEGESTLEMAFKPAPTPATSICAGVSDVGVDRDLDEAAEAGENYKERAARLSVENEALKSRMETLESLVQRMEQRMEDQDQRLRQTEAGLKGGTQS